MHSSWENTTQFVSYSNCIAHTFGLYSVSMKTVTPKAMKPPDPSSNGAGNGRPSRLQRQRLRPLKSPTPIQVRTDEDGLPTELHRRGKQFRVVAVRERWRIDDKWWCSPISREYFALVLEDGRPVILFRDLVAGGWYGQ